MCQLYIQRQCHCVVCFNAAAVQLTLYHHPHNHHQHENILTVIFLSLLFLWTVQYNTQTLVFNSLSVHTREDSCSILSLSPLLMPRISFLPWTDAALRNIWFWPWKEDQGLHLMLDNQGSHLAAVQFQGHRASTSALEKARDKLCGLVDVRTASLTGWISDSFDFWVALWPCSFLVLFFPSSEVPVIKVRHQ